MLLIRTVFRQAVFQEVLCPTRSSWRRAAALRSLADDVESVADSDPLDGDVARLVVPARRGRAGGVAGGARQSPLRRCAARASTVLSAANLISQANPVDAVAESPVTR